MPTIFLKARLNAAFRFVEVFRSWYGPVLKAFAPLEHPQRHALEADIVELIARFNQSGDHTA